MKENLFFKLINNPSLESKPLLRNLSGEESNSLIDTMHLPQSHLFLFDTPPDGIVIQESFLNSFLSLQNARKSFNGAVITTGSFVELEQINRVLGFGPDAIYLKPLNYDPIGLQYYYELCVEANICLIVQVSNIDQIASCIPTDIQYYGIVSKTTSLTTTLIGHCPSRVSIVLDGRDDLNLKAKDQQAINAYLI